MRIFRLDNEYSVVCTSEGTRYGFRHLATLVKNGRDISKAKVTYYNRTWEAFEFQTVVEKLIRGYFSDDIKLRDKFLSEIK